MYKILLITLFFIIQTVWADPLYLLCGSDEDGCLEGYEQYCACIPAGINKDQPYCLDFDKMTCDPLALRPHCDKNMKFSNKAQCVATIFQSEPVPPCREVTQSFCISHSVYMCDENGNPDSCKKPT